MLSISLNWWAIVACTAVCMLSGFIWYNPRTFFTIWWKGIGKTEKDDPGSGGSGGMALTWVLTVVSSFVQAVVMSVLVSVTLQAFAEYQPVVVGLATGLVAWLGFVAPTYLVNKLFAGHKLRVWAIEVGNHLVNFLLFGVILSIWR